MGAAFSQLNVNESEDEGRTKGNVFDVGKRTGSGSRSSLKERARALTGAARPPRNKRQCQEASRHREIWFLEQTATAEQSEDSGKMPSGPRVQEPTQCPTYKL